MKSKKRKKAKIFKLGLRLSFYTALASGLFMLLLSWIVEPAIISFNVWFVSAFTILIFVTSYIVSSALEYRRLKTLEKIAKNIARKRFEEYGEITSGRNDEIDYLIVQLIKASRTVEHEIQRLNRIENYRKEFIGDISHELKTPIFAIQGFIETLLDGALEDENVNRDFLKKAMRNVNRLLYLTKDLMEISKLETGELKPDIEEINLYDVIHDVVESLQYKAENDNVTLQLTPFDKNIKVKADRNQIKQVLINLIENGIKYNVPKGKVLVEVHPHKNGNKHIEVHIKDTGIGIEQTDLSRVTERFFRVEKSRARERGGTGLGLAIVKHIMEAHGEQLLLESTPNKGSVFKFTLLKVKRERI